MGRRKSITETLTQYFFKLSKRKRLALTPAPEYQGATLYDIDRYLFENFRSVYEHENYSAKTPTRFTDLPSDVKASKRFLVPEATKGSLIEEARRNTASIAPMLEEAMPLVAQSRDPYFDFRLSMMEMVEAQHMDGFGKLDWDFLEQMLIYLLELNDKRVHDVIFRAFMDLIESIRLMSNGSSPFIK